MKYLFIILLCVSPILSMAQVNLDVSGGLSVYGHSSIAVELETGQIESISYNPINCRITYDLSPISLGLSFSYYEFVNNFNNLFFEDVFFPEISSYYVNGGYDKTVVSSMAYISMDFLKEDIVSVFSALGIANHLRNTANRLRIREVRDDLFPNQEVELNGDQGYSAPWTAEIGIRLNTPKAWQLGAYVECLYTVSQRGFQTTRLGEEETPINDFSKMPRFNNNNIWFRAGLRFPLSSPVVSRN